MGSNLKQSDLKQEVAMLLNKHSVENDSNTPDWILAEYLLSCLYAWEAATLARDGWYGISPSPGKAGPNA